MKNTKLIEGLRHYKEENKYTLRDISKRLDIHISTLERWLKTERINKVYAEMVRERLGIK